MVGGENGCLKKRPPEGVSFEGNAFHLQITGLYIVYTYFYKKAMMFVILSILMDLLLER